MIEVIERPRINPTTREVVREFCRRTRQPAIAREEGGRLELTDLEVEAGGELDTPLLRLGEMVLRFHREAVLSWDRLPLGDEAEWARRDDEIDREAWFLERRITLDSERRLGCSWTVPGAWTVARSLERIADHAVTLGELGPRLADLGDEAGPLRELRQFHGQAMRHLEEVLRHHDGARANDLLDVGEALLAGGRALADRLLPSVGDGSMAPAVAASVARALDATARTVAYSQDIAQAFFDHGATLSGSAALRTGRSALVGSRSGTDSRAGPRRLTP